MLLPNNKNYSNQSFNTYKGLSLGDYSDKFFLCLKKEIIDEEIEALKKVNQFYFDKIDFNTFIDINYLHDYVDTKYNLNYNFKQNYKKYYKHWEVEDFEDYKQFIENYINIVSKKIESRAERMINDLKTMITNK